MRRWRVGLGLVVVLAALAGWQLWRSGENPVGEVKASSRAQIASVVTQPVVKSKREAAAAVTVTDAGTLPKGVIATFGWGSGAGQLGRDRPREGNPEAPMSVAVDAKGTSWVLDQVNKRLVRVDSAGQTLPPIDLPLQAPQDVTIARDGTAVVMDRLVDKSVALIGPDGVAKGELALVGKGLKEGGAATGIFTDGTTVVVERTHGDSVRIGSTDGVPDAERTEIPGRPTRDGSAYLTASLFKPSGVMLTVIDAANRAHRFTRQYPLPAVVRSVVLLEGDAHGIVYLGAQLATDQVAIICVDALDGHPVGLVQVPANSSADETFREFTVTDDGEIVTLARSEQGAELRRFSCP